MKKLLAIFLVSTSLLVLSWNANAQLTDIVSFNNNSSPKGDNPLGDVIRVGSRLYGMTVYGGASNAGVIFSVDTNGTNYKDLFDFSGPTGGQPNGSLIYLGGKLLYGMTSNGGTSSGGDIFSVDTNGTGFRDLWNFQFLSHLGNGSIPLGNLTYSGRTFFGMTSSGGNNSFGNIFSIDTNGTHYKDLWDFNNGGDSNGSIPNGSLTLSRGKLYGTTQSGGIYSNGNIFKIDTNGANYKDMHDFNAGALFGNLTLSGSQLFGMTSAGGQNGQGNIFSIDTTGTRYKSIWSFDNGGDTNGSQPVGSLILLDRTLFGMTTQGGINSDGNIFSIDSAGGGYKDLQDFNNTNGDEPWGSLLAASTYLYGMTEYGGTHSDGVIFKLYNELKLALSDTNVYCHGNNSASATAHLVGGTPPYTYLWNDAHHQTNITATGLSVGTYTVYAHDAYSNEDTAFVTITQPNVLTALVNTSANVICNGTSTGILSCTTGGGTRPYAYSWTGGATDSITSGLSAGSYTLTLSDIHGCSVTASNIVSQPAPLTAFANTTNDVNCHNGSNGTAVSTVNGGTSPFTYLWTGGGTNSTISGLTAGTYTLTVRDACGGLSTANTTVSQPNALSATATTQSNISCHGEHDGTISSIVNGGTTPYTYAWSPSAQTNSFAFGLGDATYTLTVRDACADITTATASITEPAALSVSQHFISRDSCKGTAWVSVSGGTGSYTYTWSPVTNTSDSISNLCAGNYCCKITDANGCGDSVCITISGVTGIANISDPTSNINAYPNPNNGSFTISTNNEKLTTKNLVEVFNMLGEKVYAAPLNQPIGGISNTVISLPNEEGQGGAADGIYLYRVLSEDGNLVGQGKLIIAK